MRARALPGKREEAYRAGITPRMLCGTIDGNIARPGARRAVPVRSPAVLLFWDQVEAGL